MPENAFQMNPLAEAWIMARAQHCQENVLEEVSQDAQRYAPVETGELRESIHVEGDRVVAEADHAVYVEYGTRYMDAQPFLRRALYQRRTLRGE